MKRFSTIILICIYAFSFTELHQLLKLPVLVQHFNEHQELNQNITFIQFLNLHYTLEDVHDDDYDRDMQLPFKDFGHCAAVQSVILTFTKIDLIEKASVVQSMAYPVLYKKFIPSSYLSEIWQPPRI